MFGKSSSFVKLHKQIGHQLYDYNYTENEVATFYFKMIYLF